MSTTDVTLNDVTSNLTDEPQVVDLGDYAEETNGGAWKSGWYPGEIIEGYATRKGTQFTTTDAPSKDGSSRNLSLCVKVSKQGEDARNMRAGFNYRLTDFTPARLAHVKEARAEYRDVKGAWPDRDAQRSSLAIAKLGQLEKAVGFKLKVTASGIIAAPYIGQRVDVYIGVDDNGYNEIKQFAPAGEKTGGKARR